MLLDGDVIPHVVEMLRGEDFYRDGHRRIFEAIRDIHGRGEPADLVTVTDRLRDTGHLEAVGGAAYVSSLLNSVPTAANVMHYSRIVLQKWGRRHLINMALEIEQAGLDGQQPDPEELLTLTERMTASVRERLQSPYGDWLAYPASEFLTRSLPPLTWLVENLLRARSVGFVFGLPATFKTMFCTQLGISVASGHPFLGRFATTQGAVLIAQEDMYEADYQALVARLISTPGDLPLFIAPSQGLKIDEHERWSAFRSLVLRRRPALVIMDAFYLVHSTEGFTGKDLSPVLDRIRALRNESGATVLLIDHPRKEAPGTRTKADPLDLLYGGRAKGAVADCIMQLVRVKNSTTQAVLTVEKQRGAPPLAPLKLEHSDAGLVLLGDADDPPTTSETLLLRWLSTQGIGATTAEIVAGTRLAPRTVKGALPRLAAKAKVEPLDRRGRATVWATPDNAAEYRRRLGLPSQDVP